MSNIFLTVKDKFFAIRSKRFRYAFFALIVFIFIFLFSPLTQVSVNRWNLENNLIKNSGKYDYVVNLPTHEEYKNLKLKNLDKNGNNGEFTNLFNSLSNSQRADFDYAYVRRYRHYSSKNNFFLNIEVITPSKNFNKLVLKNSDSRLPNKVGEGVLTPRFYQSHKKVYPEKIPIFDKKIQIVGEGLKLNAYSFGYIETLQVDNILKTSSPTKKLYEKGGWLYVTPEQFNQWVADKKIVNYKNLFYLKMTPGVNHETVLATIKAEITEKTEGFIPDLNSFVGDINSGVKMTVNDKSLFILIIIFAFSFFSLLFLMFFLTDQEMKKSKSVNKNLKALGYSNSWISFSYTIHNFFFLVVVAFVAYFAGTPLYYFFSNLVLSSVNIDLTPHPFSIWGFLFFVLGLPSLWALGVFIFSFYYIRRLFQGHNLSSGKSLNSWMFFQKIFMLFHRMKMFSGARQKIFSLFVFKNGFKKFLVFLFSVFLIILSFLLIFVKVSFDNYTRYQTSFVNSDVTSMTEFEHTLTLSLNRDKIMSHLDTFDIQKEDLKPEKNKIIQNRSEFNREIFSFVSDKRNIYSKKFFHRNKEAKDMPFIKDIFRKNKFDSIHLGRAPYDSKKDLPGLLLQSVFSSKKIITQSFKNQEFNSEIIFMSNNVDQKNNAVQNINDYLKIYTDIHDRLPELKITSYGKLGVDKNKIPYILAPIDYRDVHGYQTGDLLKIKFKVEKKFFHKEYTFRIAGFIPPNILANSIVFADYQFLLANEIVEKEDNPIYNLIITRNAPKHFDRFAVLDVVRTRNFFPSEANSFDLDSTKLSQNKFMIANIKSLTLQKVGHLLTYHFQVFEVFFTMILSLNILFAFVLLFLVSTFLFEDNQRMFVNLRSSGYKIYELTLVFIIFFILQLLVAGTLAFLISYGIFNFVSAELLSFGVTLRIFNAGFYLLYMLAGLLVFLILMVIYQLKHFKKQNLTRKANY